jgi:hypothetical protein
MGCRCGPTLIRRAGAAVYAGVSATTCVSTASNAGLSDVSAQETANEKRKLTIRRFSNNNRWNQRQKCGREKLFVGGARVRYGPRSRLSESSRLRQPLILLIHVNRD